jgi:hypothetical protein
LQAEFAGESTLKALCPHPQHADTTPSFFIFSGKHYAKCFGCGYYTSNPLELLALLMNASVADALHIMNERFKLSYVPRKTLEALREQTTNQLAKQAIVRACNNVMCDTVADPTAYPYAKEALDWLTLTRRVPRDVLHALPIGIVPPLADLSTRIDNEYSQLEADWRKNAKPFDLPPENVADAAINYMSEAYHWQHTTGSVLYPLHINLKEIGRLKLRKPDSGEKTYYYVPDDFEDMMGLFGVGWEHYKPFFDSKNTNTWAYVTEGEMDVLSYMAHALKRDTPRIPLFSASGSGGAPYIEPILEQLGVVGARYIGDAPHGNGDRIVEEWLKQTKTMHTKVFIGWDHLAPAKDLDDAILQHSSPEMVEKYLWRDGDLCFLPAWQWVAERAQAVIDTLPPNDFRRIIEHAASYGQLIRNRYDIERYCTEIADKYDKLTVPLLKREIASNENTESGFIMRCVDALRDRMAPLITVVEGQQRSLVLFDKLSQEYRKVKLDSEQSIAQELAPSVGSVVQFVRNEVGFPDFMEDPDESEGLNYRRVDGNVRNYLRISFSDMAQGVRDFSSVTRRKQGYHAIPLGDSTDQVVEYVACGKQVFRIHREEEAEKTSYTQLDGPADQDIFFDLGYTSSQNKDDSVAWYPGGLSTGILENAANIDIQQLYKNIYEFYNVGYNFMTHDVMCQFLAAQVMAFPISDIFPRQTLMFVTGESKSGKSYLTASFDGRARPELRLVYASQGDQSYSVAGVMRRTDGDTRLLCLDEFELDGKKADVCGAIFEHLRGLVNHTATRTVAMKDGKGSYTTFHRMPVVLSGINGAERVQDLNRLIIIEMKNVPGRNEPTHDILKHFGGAGKIQEMARQIAVGLYPHIPAIMERYRKISNQFYAVKDTLPVPVESRFATGMFGAMAVMDYLGQDWQLFLRDYTVANEHLIRRTAVVSESASLLGSMLNSSSIFQNDVKKRTSVATLLASPNTRTEINTEGVGVFYDETQKLLLILLSQAMPILIPQNHLMRRAPEVRVRDTLERHRLALTRQQIINSGVLQRAKLYMGANIDENDVVVFHAEPWLGEELPASVKRDDDEKMGGVAETKMHVPSAAELAAMDAEEIGW